MQSTCSIIVRTYECDEYHHVNNAVYLNYFEHARMLFMNEIGFDYFSFRNLGYGLVVAKATLRYKHPAVLNDELIITTTPLKKKTAGGIFYQAIHRVDTLICDAEITWVCINKDGRPCRIPEAYNLDALIPEET